MFVDHQHVQVGLAGFAVDDRGDVADALGRVAVGAEPGDCAGRLLAEAQAVGRRGLVLDVADRVGEVALDDLVAAGHDDDFRRAVDHGVDAVAVAVDVDEAAVERDRVGAAEEEVAGLLALHDRDALLEGQVGEAVVQASPCLVRRAAW